MKFCDNLPKLRKEHHLSQEQLAEKLNVSRQAVSKWESGSAYPEMDKIIAMAKIFNCSIDELMNENISSLKKEEEIGKSPNNKWEDYINKIRDFINKTIDYFRAHSLKEGIKTICFMLLIILVLIIAKIPVNEIENIGLNLFYSLPSFISSLVCNFWQVIVEIAYLILAVFVVVNVFKHCYLDKDDNLEKVETKKEDSKNEKIVKVSNNQSKYSFGDIILKIALWCLKGFVIVIAIPLVFTFLFMVVAFAFSIYLLFQKVFYLGFTISLLAGLVLNIIILEIAFNFVFNIKQNSKRIFITLISGVIVLGIGISMVGIDIANSTFINEAPQNLHTTVKTEEFTMQDDLIIHFHYLASAINYVVNDSNDNKIKIELEYYDTFTNFDVIQQENSLDIVEQSKTTSFKDIYELIIKDLQSKTFHSYDAIRQVKIKVIASQENINKLKENLNNYQEYENDYYINNLENELSVKNEQLEEWEDKYAELKEEYEEKISEYQEKIEEYKDSLELLD